MSVMIDGFEIDLAESEEHTLDSEITEHPVETGSDTADNIRNKPIYLMVRGVVSDTPVGPIADRRGDRDTRGQLVNKPSDDFRAWLQAIRARREPIQVVSSKGVIHENMGMERLSFVEDAKTGDAIRFVCGFKQLELVTNERTTVLVALPRAANKVNRGHKPSPKVPDVPPKPKKARDQSITMKGVRALGFFGGD
jgi:hypothetical protein